MSKDKGQVLHPLVCPSNIKADMSKLWTHDTISLGNKGTRQGSWLRLGEFINRPRHNEARERPTVEPYTDARENA
jgi:hypothetical protein